MSLDVELDDLRGVVVGGPKTFVGGQKQHLRCRRVAGAELIEILALLVEYLNAVVFAIGDVDLARLRVHLHPVHRVERARRRVVRRRGLFSP